MFTKYREDIVSAYGFAIRQLEDQRDLLLKTMESLQAKAYEAVNAAIAETYENCLREDYQPTSDCADLIWKLAYHQLSEEIALFRYNVSVSEDAVRNCVTAGIDFNVRELAESEVGREMQERNKSAINTFRLKVEILPGLAIPAKTISPFPQSCKLAEVLAKPAREGFQPENQPQKCSKAKQDLSRGVTLEPQVDQWICSKCGQSNDNFSPIENDQRKIRCSNCSTRKEAVTTKAPPSGSHSQKTLTSTKFIPESPQPKQYCECGIELKHSELQCEACDVRVISPVKREGKLWKCFNCGKDNPSSQDTCKLCFRRKPTRALIVDNSPKCQNCSRFVVTGESLCLVCKQRQGAKLQESKWTCKSCKTSNSLGSCTICGKARTYR